MAAEEEEEQREVDRVHLQDHPGADERPAFLSDSSLAQPCPVLHTSPWTLASTLRCSAAAESAWTEAAPLAAASAAYSASASASASAVVMTSQAKAQSIESTVRLDDWTVGDQPPIEMLSIFPFDTASSSPVAH